MQLFDEISEQNFLKLKECLKAVKKSYLKDEIIFDYGDKLSAVGYVLSGKVRILKDDFENNKVLIAEVEKTQTFAEALVCAGIKKSPVTVIAAEDSEILFIDFQKILGVCASSCPFHKQLIENIIKIIANKNLFLNSRIELLSKKSLKERIMFYLKSQKEKQNKEIFEIPFSREKMAQYLAVDRSALSRELCRMKSANLLDFHKNSFRIFF